jgi:hypothetical protein
MTHTITLTTTELRDARACPAGLRAFQKLIGKGKRSISFNPADPLIALWSRCVYGQYVHWLERDKHMPPLALRSTLIQNAELRDLTAVGSQWSLVNIRKSNIFHATFNAALFDTSSISHSDLFGSRFNNATFLSCNLFNLTLTQTYFGHTRFSQCSFSDLSTRLASFHGAVFTDCTFTDCDLSDGNFKYAIFRGCRFDRCKFSGAHLGKAILSDGFYSNTDLGGALRFKEDPPLPGYRTKKYKPVPDYVVLESRYKKPTRE